MKKLYYVFLIGILFSSCETEVEPHKGTIKFNLSKEPLNEGRIENDNASPASVLISIKDSQGNFIKENYSLPLISFGQGYVSESIEFNVGNYTITQFLVLDENEDVIYATPVENSPLAHLVNDPLPIAFTVAEDEGSLITLQVAPVAQGNTPEDFGYVSFAFDVTDQPTNKNIEISFVAPQNPHYVTNGYDSVIVSFYTPERFFKKRLSVISPVEARGLISWSDLGITTGDQPKSWIIDVSAYYESIDVVESNVHVNQAILRYINLNFSHETTNLIIRENAISVHNSAGEYASKPAMWENWAHLTDVTGYFHFVVNNDPCFPLLAYDILKPGVSGVYYDKVIMDDIDYYDYRWNSNNQSTAVGPYYDADTFSEMCPDEIVGTLYADLYFRVYTTDGAAYICYLVWQYENTPVDPQGKVTQDSKSNGVYKVMTAEEFSALRNQRQGRVPSKD